MSENEIACAGDPRHPDHHSFLKELGSATYAASSVAGMCFDLLRVLGGVSSQSMYSDPLGVLEQQLESLSRAQPRDQGLRDFLAMLSPARETRNDLLHALPVRDGLHRRKSNNPAYVRNFFTIDDLRTVTEELSAVGGQGNALLHADGGAAVRAWYAAGGS